MEKNVLSEENEVEVLGQTGVVDVVKNNNTSEPENKPIKKGMNMNLKTLFLMGIGAVILLCVIGALIVKLTAKKVTVTFDTDGGSKIASVKVRKGKSINQPKKPNKKDYQFVEWQLDGKEYDFSDKVTKDIKLKAVWEIKLTDDVYTITFDTKGGNEIESQSVNGNGKVKKPEDPTRIYSKFVEWQLDGQKYDFDSLVKSDITLVAEWTLVQSHRVKVDYDGGGTNYFQEVYEGEKIPLPETPKKEGYKFIEWQKDGQKYNFETPVINDFTIKAKYEEAKKYTVTFKDGESVIISETVSEGSTITKPNNPTKNNYTFKSWQLDGRDYDFDTEVTGDITLKANWDEVKTCEVSLIDKRSDDNKKLGVIKIKCGTSITEKQVEENAKDLCVQNYFNPKCYSTVEYNGTNYDFNSVINENIQLLLN